MKFKNILVVGGGSSGWMTAAAICKFFKPEENVKVSLVESKNIKTIGVGESTIASINTFLDILGLGNDEDWMAACEATYKNSIRFTDFRDNDTVFEYPFGGTWNFENGVMSWAEMKAQNNLDADSFAEFFNENTFLAKYNRCTKNERGYLDGFSFKQHTAYHFDAELFAHFLREKICEPAGMPHYIDDIVGAEKDEKGFLTCVVGESGQKYTADLFVDCTGFRSLLLEKEMGSKFISYKPWLANDSALATCIPYVDKEEELHNVTNCTAIENGWVWDIPLWHRIGTGYVYSSDFVDDETAEKEFRKHLARDPRFAKRAEEAELRKIDIRHGIHEEGWVKNVVGIGLAYGFVEPLESTGLVSTHSNIIRFLELLQRRKFNLNRFDLDTYNYAAAHELNGFRDFVAVHYAASSRCDTPYWQYVTQEKSYRGLGGQPVVQGNNQMTFTDNFESAMHVTQIHKVWTPQFAGWNYIMGGMDYCPFGEYFFNLLVEDHPEREEAASRTYEQWKDHVENITSYVLSLPTHYEFLKEHIYKDETD